MSEQTPASRSLAQQEASRRNGAKGRGPKTAAGKAKSARNALRHGLRAGQPAAMAAMPAWVADLDDRFMALGNMDVRQREFLDQLGAVAIMLEKADQLLLAEASRLAGGLGLVPGEQGSPDGTDADGSAAATVSTLRKYAAYRRRFRAQRDQCLRKIGAASELGPACEGADE
jgi:hypothetical protein